MCAEAREVRALKAYRMRAQLQCCRAGAMQQRCSSEQCFGGTQDLLVTGGEEGINGQVCRFAPDAAPIRRRVTLASRGLGFGLAAAFQ